MWLKQSTRNLELAALSLNKMKRYKRCMFVSSVFIGEGEIHVFNFPATQKFLSYLKLNICENVNIPGNSADIFLYEAMRNVAVK